MSILRPQKLHTGKWWDAPWSIIDGCTEVSEGCDHCWSKAIARRFKRDWTPRFRPDRLEIPLRARKPRVYAVWNDLFHEAVSDAEICHAFNVMWKCHHTGKGHFFMVLTKRIERARDLLRKTKRIPHIHGIPIDQEMGPQDAVPPNVALGVTVESQEHVGRVGELLAAWPGLTFVSVEPMLGGAVLPARAMHWVCRRCGLRIIFGERETCSECGACDWTRGLDLVICGGESGPGARPMGPEWARDLRDQCKAAGVPFICKQMGGNRPMPEDLMIRQWFGDTL